MTSSLMVFQIIISVILILLVLLQFGKGAEAGLFSSTESFMSTTTQGNILTKITALVVVLFLGNSILLAKFESSKGKKSILDDEAPVARPLNNDAAATPAATTTPPTAGTAAPAK